MNRLITYIISIVVVFTLVGCTKQIVNPGIYDICRVTEFRPEVDDEGNDNIVEFQYEYYDVRVYRVKGYRKFPSLYLSWVNDAGYTRTAAFTPEYIEVECLKNE